MTSTFIENESYKHKMAKEVLKGWLEEYNNKENKLKTNYKDVNISFRGDIWLEYPIVKYDNINSIEWDWDNILRNNKWNKNISIDDYKEYIKDMEYEEIEPYEAYVDGYTFIPTYKECVDNGYYPISIIDLVCCHKGHPFYCFEICHKNPISNEKIDKLDDIPYLIEIDADWILNQVKKPEILKIKRLFRFGEEQKNM